MPKCCYIHFRSNVRVRPFADSNDKFRVIFINGSKISHVSHTKFLGIVIDEKLSWDPHIQYLTKKIRSITGAISRIRKSMPADLYLKLYNALYESHIN